MKNLRLNTKTKKSEVETIESSEVTNINLITEKKAKKATNKVQSAIAARLESLDYSKAIKLTKAVKSIDFLFSSIRSIILSLVANNQSLNIFDKTSIVATLRKSKKDVELYVLLRRLAAFNYKTVKRTENEITTLNIIKSFSVKSVLNACIVFEQISAVELTENLIVEIQREHEENAVNSIKNAIDKLQSNCNVTSNLIENLKDSAKAEKLELSERLERLEQQLIEKVKIYDYVKIQTNRRLIK